MDEEVIKEDIINEIESAMPAMNVNSQPPAVEKENLISDECLLSIYSEVLTNLREDRVEVKNLVGTFTDLVINDGDATSASKEALVNLIKIQTDGADKMAKIADLMTRIKLKDKDTFPRYLNAKQENNLYIGDGKRELLKQIDRLQKKKKEQQ